LWGTLLAVLTVVSGVPLIRIALLPARPSRLKATSMPSARKNVARAASGRFAHLGFHTGPPKTFY
jgi:hypothetical protein